MSNLGDVLRQVVCIPTNIPEDWSFYKLPEICSPKQWRTISATEMSITGYPVFGANGFVGFYHEYNHEEETIAITCRGNTCGSINRIPPKTYITGNSMALDNIKGTLISQDYLFYALKYRGVGDSISGSAQPQITGAGLRSIEFPAPKLPEQQKIATILLSVDDVIEKTRGQIDKLKDLKTGMLQEFLTKGIGHTEFQDSFIGLIPKIWKVMPLKNLVKDNKKITYGIVQAGKHCDDGVPYIRVSDMTKRFLTIEGMLRTSNDIAQKYQRSSVSTGDIVYALRGMIGHVHIVPPELDGANLTQGTARISPNLNISSRYLFWAMKSPYVQRQNEDEAKGSTFKEITLASLQNIQIAVPPIKEQCHISKVLDSFDKNIMIHEDRLKHFEFLKKALMQDLLTGKIRVNIENHQKERMAV